MDDFNSTLSPHKSQPTDTNNQEPPYIDNGDRFTRTRQTPNQLSMTPTSAPVKSGRNV